MRIYDVLYHIVYKYIIYIHHTLYIRIIVCILNMKNKSYKREMIPLYYYNIIHREREVTVAALKSPRRCPRCSHSSVLRTNWIIYRRARVYDDFFLNNIKYVVRNYFI